MGDSDALCTPKALLVYSVIEIVFVIKSWERLYKEVTYVVVRDEH